MAALSTWLTADKIQYIDSAKDWQDALEIVAQPLLAEQIISDQYVPNIIKQKNQLGAYFVIAPGIAMPHARPEEGGLKLGLSLLKLANPLSFGSEENDPVDVVVMFAAPDSNSHIELISSLAEFLSDDVVMARIFNAQSHQELVVIINSFQ